MKPEFSTIPMDVKNILINTIHLVDSEESMIKAISDSIIELIMNSNNPNNYEGIIGGVDLTTLPPSELFSKNGFGKETAYKFYKSHDREVEKKEVSYPLGFVIVTFDRNEEIEVIKTKQFEVPERIIYSGMSSKFQSTEKEFVDIQEEFSDFMESIASYIKENISFVVFRVNATYEEITTRKPFLKLFRKRYKNRTEERVSIQFIFHMPQLLKKFIEYEYLKKLYGDISGQSVAGENGGLVFQFQDKNGGRIITERIPAPEEIMSSGFSDEIKIQMMEAYVANNYKDKFGPRLDKESVEHKNKVEEIDALIHKGVTFANKFGIKESWLKDSINTIQKFYNNALVFNNLIAVSLEFGSNSDSRINAIRDFSDENNYEEKCMNCTILKGDGIHVIGIKPYNEEEDNGGQIYEYMQDNDDGFVSAVILECQLNPQEFYDRKYSITWYVFRKGLENYSGRVNLHLLKEEISQ